MEKYASFKILLGTHPIEAYTQAVLQHLCNVFPKLSKEIIIYYLQFYSGLLIPTFRSFKLLYKEHDGKAMFNNVDMQQQLPLHQFVEIDSTDECFISDLEVLNDNLKIKEYVKLYSDFLREKSQPVHEDLVDCNECFDKKLVKTTISCTENHCICQDCLRSQARTLLASIAIDRHFVCNCGSNCTGQFDRADVERYLDNPDLYKQLVDHHVFDPFPRLPKLSKEEMNDLGWLCQINRTIMKNPVRCQDNFVYEHDAIRNFFNAHHMSPMTFVDWKSLSITPEKELQKKIFEYLSVYPES